MPTGTTRADLARDIEFLEGKGERADIRGGSGVGAERELVRDVKRGLI